MKIDIVVGNSSHIPYAETICETILEASKMKGTGLAKRTPEHVTSKLEKGNAVIALENGNFAGFCYIDAWEDEKYVAHSGLIVHPKYRNSGLAKKIKKAVFDLSREKYPNAKIFGITTGLTVMKINSDLGYRPVTFSELTDDPAFWKGCETCQNFDILKRTKRSICLCTGMLYDPEEKKNEEPAEPYSHRKTVWKRLQIMKKRTGNKSEKETIKQL